MTRRCFAPASGVRTPWGMSQTAESFGEGITFYSTSSHGGFKVEGAALRQMPSALRVRGGWFEEDAESALVMVAFPDQFAPAQVAAATCVVKDSFPDRYTAWTGIELDATESRTLRHRAFTEQTASAYIVRAAWGDGFAFVPAGMVGVLAFRASTNEEAGFLLPADVYKRRGEFGFVVDPTAAEPWIAPGKTKEAETILLSRGEPTVTPDDLQPGRRVRFGDGVYVLESPNNRSWIVKRASDGRMFRMGPSQLKASTVAADEARESAA